ncbi:MAG: hypothetical protein ABF969_04190 [Sporolactobacillus sp.]
MAVKQYDVVQLKNGLEGTVIEVFHDHRGSAYLVEIDKPDDRGIYPTETVRDDDIGKVTYSITE